VYFLQLTVRCIVYRTPSKSRLCLWQLAPLSFRYSFSTVYRMDSPLNFASLVRCNLIHFHLLSHMAVHHHLLHHLHDHHFHHLLLVQSSILTLIRGSLTNAFQYRPFLHLPNWLRGFPCHLTFFTPLSGWICLHGVLD